MISLMARIYERGQITIPKDIRERVGLHPGDELTIRVRDDQIVIRRARSLFDIRLPDTGEPDMTWSEARAAALEERLARLPKLHR